MGNRSKITEGPILRSFSQEFFHLLEIVTRWLVPSAGQKILVEPGWYLPPQKRPLDENRFRQAGKGAETTQENSRQCFTDTESVPLCVELEARQFWIFCFGREPEVLHKSKELPNTGKYYSQTWIYTEKRFWTQPMDTGPRSIWLHFCIICSWKSFLI